MAIQTARQGVLEGSVNGKDALRWIDTAKTVLNGKKVDIPIPDDAMYVLFECVKAVEGGQRYNVVFFAGLPELAAQNGYLTLGRSEVGIQKNRIYKLPEDARQIHLGTDKKY